MFINFINCVQSPGANLQLRSKSSLPSRTSFGIGISCLAFRQRQVGILSLPATFITIFLFLWPQNVFEDDGTDHHTKDEKPASDEETSEHAA